MAFPSSFDESNACLGKPREDMADDCDALSICRTETVNGTPVVVSCWKLTAEELAEVVRTGRVWLTIAGHTMPPAHIQGIKPLVTSPPN